MSEPILADANTTSLVFNSMSMKTKRLVTTSLAISMLAIIVSTFSFANNAFAALSAVGPIEPNSGFPRWYEDSNGLRLDLMEAADTFGISDPVDAGNPFSQQIGFNAEGFWWSADAKIGTQATLVLAMEAAFAGEAAVDGEQSAFGRIRYRVDGLIAGETYTIRHPFGTVSEVADVDGTVNVSSDIGGFGVPGFPANFNIPLVSGIGPFLTWSTFDPNPADTDPLLKNNQPAYASRVYIGNPAVEHEIIGSPITQNFFRVEGPGLPGGRIETDLFTVTGRLFSPIVTVNALSTNDSSPALTGTVNDPTATIETVIDGNAFAAINNGNGTWTLANNSITPALADGTYDVQVSATPTAGGVGTDNTDNELTIDATAPALPVILSIAGDDNMINGSEKVAIEIAGTAEVNSVINASLTDGNVTVNGNAIADNNGEYVLIINGTTLAEGVITPSVTSTDASGNISISASMPTATLDSIAPVVTGVVSNNIYNTNKEAIFNEGTAKLNEKEYVSGETISDEVIYSLIVSDIAGNITAVVFQIDKTGPAISGVISGGKYGSDIMITFSDGAATLDGAAFASGSTVSNEGTHTLVATDSAGNSTNVEFILDKSLALSSIQIVGIAKRSAIITWTTTNSSVGRVFYGTNKKKLRAIAADNNENTTHSVLIRGLKKKTKYYFYITTERPDGSKQVKSAVGAFKTKKK